MRCLKLAALLGCGILAAAMITVFNSSICFAEGESYTFYCGNTSADCKVITVEGSAAIKKLALKNICGESTVYENLDVQAFLEEVGGEIIFTEELSDSVNYYCTADLPYEIELYGYKINLHICVKDCGVTVASPIIFGGY